jgi:hypothetical protein
MLVLACAILFAFGIASSAAGDEDIAGLVARQDIAALNELGPATLPEILRLYRAGDEAGRANIAWVLYHLGWKSEEAKQLLMADVKTQHEGLRIWSQYALGRVSNSDDVVDVLFENMMTTDAKWLFRDKAACGLAYDQIHLTEPQKVRLFGRMIDVLDDADTGTRRLAIQVLAVYTGQTKGYDAQAEPEARQASIERWRQWLAEYRSQL